ncbi:hypothetical protein GCM10010145_38380 [Streptomyces ruber]|uniref:NERD domain-containing protein n=2 Tax=Streptomyces TaxID=1883 RepID=A0A918ETA2_9ACTN|nr:hypothetical protein GCM10010145_38380 [Streptomyces ruber]
MIAPGGIHLIELKDWHGSVESRNGTWLQTQPNGRQIPQSRSAGGLWNERDAADGEDMRTVSTDTAVTTTSAVRLNAATITQYLASQPGLGGGQAPGRAVACRAVLGRPGRVAVG